MEARAVTTADGLQIFVRDYRSGVDHGRRPIFCIHGLTRNSADFEDLAPVLADTGRRVIVPDMRGRGRSEWDSQPQRYRGDVYAGDVQAVMDELQITDAVFIGTSMGGIITMLLAAVAPDRIVAAVLNDIGPIVNAAGRDRIMGYVGNVGPYPSLRAIMDAIKSVQKAAFPDAGEEFWERFAHRVTRERPDATFVFDYDPAIRQALLAPPATPQIDLQEAFVALADKELLLVHGATSDILTPDGIVQMRLTKPDMQVVDISGVGHAPTLDEPVARDAIKAFLSGIP